MNLAKEILRCKSPSTCKNSNEFNNILNFIKHYDLSDKDLYSTSYGNYFPAQCLIRQLTEAKNYKKQMNNFLVDIATVPVGGFIGGSILRASKLTKLGKIGTGLAAETIIYGPITYRDIKEHRGKCKLLKNIMRTEKISGDTNSYQRAKNEFNDCESGLIYTYAFSLIGPLSVVAGPYVSTVLHKLKGGHIVDAVNASLKNSNKRPLSDVDKYLLEQFAKHHKAIGLSDDEIIRMITKGCGS